MSDPLVTVTAYAAQNDARTAQNTLDSAGIPAVIDPAPHKARVRVPNLDAIKAGDVLTARCPALAEIDEADEEERELVCPACGSPDIISARRARMFGLVVTLAIVTGYFAEMLQAAVFAVAAAAVFLLIGGRWRCETCDETWD